MTPYYTHSDNTKCLGYSTNMFSFASYGINPMGFFFVTGRLEVCVSSRQGYYASFCNDTLSELLRNSKSIWFSLSFFPKAPSIVNHMCGQYYIGFPYLIIGNTEAYGVNTRQNVITNITCPMSGSNLDSCNVTITNDTTCSAYGGTSIISCVNSNYNDQ